MKVLLTTYLEMIFGCPVSGFPSGFHISRRFAFVEFVSLLSILRISYVTFATNRRAGEGGKLVAFLGWPHK